MQNIQTKKRVGFTSFFPKATPQAMDLLRKLLSFSPEERITVEQALAHPYVAAFHNEKSELVIARPVKVQINDNKKLTIKDYRDTLYQYIAK